MKPTYTINEAAEALGIYAGTVRSYITHGQLAATKDEKGRWLVPATEITRLKNWRKHNPLKKEKRKP